MRRLLISTVVLLSAAVASPGAGATGQEVLTPAMARAVARARLSRADHARVAEVVTRSGTAGVTWRRRAGRLKLQAGEAVSATAKNFSAIRLFTQEGQSKAQLRKLRETFVPRGVDYDPERKIIAIAAVSRVVLYETSTGFVTVLRQVVARQNEPFGFANDVLFDRSGGLLIADMGAAATGVNPRDGKVWRYDLDTGVFTQLGFKRKMSNPKLLARDAKGTIYVVDGEAGPLITPAFNFRYDTLYELRGPVLQGAGRVYGGPGIQATAYDIGPDRRHWFGNVTEIVTLRKGELSVPCPLPPPFEFLTGLAVVEKTRALVMDGAAVKGGEQTLYEVDRACGVTPRLTGAKLTNARGLALVDEAAQ